MNPSDAGGGHDSFDVWAQIALPAIGILVAVAVPLIVLYWQRNADSRRFKEQRTVDDRRLEEQRELEDRRIREERERSDARLREQREIAETERLREAQKRATRDAVAALAPFVGLDPFRVDVHPLLVNLRIALMILVDEFPADHPLNDLVSFQHHLGIATANAILEAGEPVPKPSVSGSTAARQKAELINPLHGWAAHFTSDLRTIQAEVVREGQIIAQTAHVRQALVNVYERNGWGDPPEQTLRRRSPEVDES